MFERLYQLFTSLKLTVVLLALGLILVFLGSVAQEPFGNYVVQQRFFQVMFVDAASLYAALYKFADIFVQGMGHPLPPLDVHRLLGAPRIPAFPGGYLIGGVLLVNLFAAHLRYYKPGWKKLGIALIHLGIVLMLLGQLLTDVLSSETSMFIRNGETKNFAESNSRAELAIVDTSEPDADKVVAIADTRLRAGGDITHPELPFRARVHKYMVNSAVSETLTNRFVTVGATAGIGTDVFWQEFPHVTAMDERDMPSGLVELFAGSESLGKYLVSFYLNRPQSFEHGGRRYTMALRPEREYKPFSLQLVEFRHDRYPGTDTPKNFSSRVRVLRPETGEDREVVIYMNNPLRYAGETYYQAGFDRDDQGTRLQVVRNPGRVTPYIACVMVALGMIWQFCVHLIGYGRYGKTK